MRLKPTIKITLIYFATGLVWIYLSDRILFLFFDFQDERRHILFQNIKGFFYVSITAVLLYNLIRNYYRNYEKRLKDLELRQRELDSIQQLTLTGSWEHDFVNGTTYWSPMSHRIFETGKDQAMPEQYLLTEYVQDYSFRKLFNNILERARYEGSDVELDVPVVLADGKEKWMRVLAKTIMENGVTTKIFGTYQDISAGKYAEEKINQLNRLYTLITEVNRLLVRTGDAHGFYRQICDVAVRTGRFRMAWIGLVNPADHSVYPEAWSGYEDGYLQHIKITTNADEPEGRGPSGRSIREGKFIICNDVETDPMVKPWSKSQLLRGYKSSISLPIKTFGKVIGAFTLYAGEKNFFNEEEVQLLNDATADIGYAVETLESDRLRRLAEEKMTEALERYDIVANATRDIIWDWNVPQKTFYYNPGITRICGYQLKDIPSRATWHMDNIHPDHQDEVRTALGQAFVERKPVVSMEYRYRCADGSYKVVQDLVSVRYNLQGKPERLIGTMHDVTTERELDLQVENAIINTQEEEREQIGMELHDNVNQILSASLMYLSGAKSDLEKQGGPVGIGFIKSEQYIQEAIQEIRRLSHQLAPVSIKEGSIPEVFERLVTNIRVGQSFTVKEDVDALEEYELSTDLKINLYRILQEQLNNIVKHSRATEVEVSLHAEKGRMVLRIMDNGVGFDAAKKSGGIGLENIRRRCRMFYGRFRLHTSPGHGCTVIVEIPLNSEDKGGGSEKSEKGEILAEEKSAG